MKKHLVKVVFAILVLAIAGSVQSIAAQDIVADCTTVIEDGEQLQCVPMDEVFPPESEMAVQQSAALDGGINFGVWYPYVNNQGVPPPSSFEARGINIIYIQGDLDVAEIAKYDVIFIGRAGMIGRFPWGKPTLDIDALISFINDGGGIIGELNSTIFDSDYYRGVDWSSRLSVVQGVSAWSLQHAWAEEDFQISITNPAHPIAQGVASSFILSGRHAYNRNAWLNVAKNPTAEQVGAVRSYIYAPPIVVTEFGQGCSVYLPTALGLYDMDWSANPDYETLFINAVEWAGSCGVTNQPPSVAADNASVIVNEGDSAANRGSVTDLDGDTVSLNASAGAVTNNNDGTWSWNFDTSDGPAESQTVTIDADDGNGGTAQTTFALTVNNVAPTIETITVPADPIDINNQPVTGVSATFSDPAGIKDENYTCTVDYNDGSGAQAGTVVGTTCTGLNQTYATPGVYAVTVTVTDKDTESGSADATEYIVIYDPAGGFVTGGGWIDSPSGACPVFCNDATGKANFGFVSKYKKGATVPTGQTQFQFRAGNLDFYSSSYDWLVIAGAKAMYKGEGAVNGVAGFTFQISAIDGQVNGGDGVDKFRIKIKETGGGVIYDNQPGAEENDDPTTALGGGSIKVHDGK